MCQVKCSRGPAKVHGHTFRLTEPFWMNLYISQHAMRFCKICSKMQGDVTMFRLQGYQIVHRKDIMANEWRQIPRIALRK